MVTPLQLYFSFKSTFTNAQVCSLQDMLECFADVGLVAVLESCHKFLLLWTVVVRALLPSLFLVSPFGISRPDRPEWMC